MFLKSDPEMSSSSRTGARWRWLHAAGLTAVLSFSSIRVNATEIPAPGSQSFAAAGASATVTSQIEVDFANGLLSVTARDADVRIVVEAIAAKSGVEIVLDKSITGKATVEFKNINIEEGSKRSSKMLLGVASPPST